MKSKSKRKSDKLEDREPANKEIKKEFQHQEIHEKAYEVNIRERSSRAENILHQLSSKRQMLVIKEIFGKPMAMRDPWE